MGICFLSTDKPTNKTGGNELLAMYGWLCYEETRETNILDENVAIVKCKWVW